MKTKAQIIEEILSIEKVDTKANLMKLSLGKLESMLNKLENELVAPEVVQESPVVSESDLVDKIKKEMLAELKEQARKEVEAEMENDEVSVKAKQASQRLEIERFEMIPIMNATSGSLIYQSRKTGAEWNWSEYGDIEYMEYQELLSMRTAHRRFFDEPFILVMDDNAVETLGLTKMYENIKSPEQIDLIFRMNQADFEEVVEKSPKGIKHLIISRAKRLYESGELDSVKKINYMNTRFNTDIGQRG